MGFKLSLLWPPLASNADNSSFKIWFVALVVLLEVLLVLLVLELESDPVELDELESK